MLKNNALKTVAHSDAVYSAVGITTAILELAVVALHPNFGNHALEKFFILQLIVSVFIETFSSIYFMRFGTVGMTAIGLIAKVMATLTFILAVILSFYTDQILIWLAIFLFQILDSVGVGILSVSYRPAYSSLYKAVTHHSAPDYFLVFKNTLFVRIGIPLLILVMIVLANMFLQENFIAMSITLFFMLALKLWHLFNYLFDFKVQYKSVKFNNEIENTPRFFAERKRILPVFYKNFQHVFFYIYASFAAFMVVMYGVGLVYKHFLNIGIPLSFTWLGGTQIGFLVFLFSTIFGRLYFHKIATFKNKEQLKFILVVTLLFLSFSVSFYFIFFKAIHSILLVLICLFVPTIAGAIRTFAVNHLLTIENDTEQLSVFLLAEFFTNILLVFAVVFSFYNIPFLTQPFINMNYVIAIFSIIILIKYFRNER